MPRQFMLICLLLILPLLLFAQSFSNGFPFYLPPDDTTSSEFLPHFPVTPIGENDFVEVDGAGHFSINGERRRFFGTNLTINGAFPTKSKAWFIAGRLRKMGYNLVRFHHMDNGWSSNSLFEWNQDTRHLNPETLGRFENMIYHLKQNGIRVNINLHVSREVKEADGIADADSIPDFGKGVSLFDPDILALHKEFAEQLLTHINPYTGLPLAEDPVAAMVEITNENSLYRMWRSNQLKHFSEGGKLTRRHVIMLNQQWIDFLAAKYADDNALKTAWNEGARPAGEGEQVRDGGFENDAITRNWTLEQHEGAKASMAIDETAPFSGDKCARINVTNVTGTGWHIQWKQVRMTIKEDSLYSVSFAGRADGARDITVSIQKDSSPWTVYYSTSFRLSSEWQVFQFSLRANSTVENAIRLSFSLGEAEGAYWFDDIHVGPSAVHGLEESESLAAAHVRRINFSESVNYSEQRVMDISEFYLETQNRYYDEMSTFLKNTIGVRVPLNSTNWNIGPADHAVQARLDYMDNHSYWDHPQFPNTPWDSYDWKINNTPMVTSEDGRTISRLMSGTPFQGKPFTISEYNHAFPNRYQSEGVLFLTVYSSFHDVDGFMFFDYPNSADDWETDKVSGFFAQHRNTAMMSLMPSCALAFRNGWLKPSVNPIAINFSRKDILSLPKYDDMWWAGPTLYPHSLALKHAVRTRTFDNPVDFDSSLLPAAPTAPYVTDTDEIEWDPNGLLQVRSSRFVAATGFPQQTLANFALIKSSKQEYDVGWHDDGA